MVTETSVGRMVGCPSKVSSYEPPLEFPSHTPEDRHTTESVPVDPDGIVGESCSQLTPFSDPVATRIALPSRVADASVQGAWHQTDVIGISSPAFAPGTVGPST